MFVPYVPNELIHVASSTCDSSVSSNAYCVLSLQQTLIYDVHDDICWFCVPITTNFRGDNPISSTLAYMPGDWGCQCATEKMQRAIP